MHLQIFFKLYILTCFFTQYQQHIHMALKRELDDQYRKWQEIIDSRNLDFTLVYDALFDDSQNTRITKEAFENRININLISLQTALPGIDEIEKVELKELMNELEHFKAELSEKFEQFCDQIVEQVRSNLRQSGQQGLSPERIQQFEKVQAD